MPTTADRSTETEKGKWSFSGLNRGPSDFQSLELPANPLADKAILNFDRGGRSAGRSGEQSEGGIPDAELAALVAAWPTLPEPIKAAIRALVGASR